MPAGCEEHRIREQPIYWFCMLEQAIRQGDLVRAAQAVRELDRLGIAISYRLARCSQEVAHE
jgi:hypothetical protein